MRPTRRPRPGASSALVDTPGLNFTITECGSYAAEAPGASASEAFAAAAKSAAARSMDIRRNLPVGDCRLGLFPSLQALQTPRPEYPHRAVSDLKTALDRARAGGPDRHHEKSAQQGKLPVRERIERLVDTGSF